MTGVTRDERCVRCDIYPPGDITILGVTMTYRFPDNDADREAAVAGALATLQAATSTDHNGVKTNVQRPHRARDKKRARRSPSLPLGTLAEYVASAMAEREGRIDDTGGKHVAELFGLRLRRRRK